MKSKGKITLVERVEKSAQIWLDDEGSVSILDVFRGMGFLARAHYEGWKKGFEHYPVLESWIQCGDDKRTKTIRYFLEWTRTLGLESFEVTYEVRGRHKTTTLRLTESGDEKMETLFRTRFRRSDLTESQKKRVEKKAKKTSDLVVYFVTGEDSKCSDCEQELVVGDLVYLESSKAICLHCADMDHLSFLPSGNATLTRRAKKFSPLAAVVLKFNRRRKRYNRQGLLVTEKAIEEAEASCEQDADVRARQREKAAERRAAMDSQLVKDMTAIILAAFPGCPEQEAAAMAYHTAQRGSGRVGRSAAGRKLDPNAMELAVRAWIRHQHTDYDSLLMNGVERMEARRQIRNRLEEKLSEWSAG